MADTARPELAKTRKYLPSDRCRPDTAKLRLVLACLAATLPGCADQPDQDNANQPRRTPITIANVRAETLRETASGIGSLQAVEQVELRAELAGTITAVSAQEGTNVNAGTLLFRLDDQELLRRRDAREAALQSAQADLTNARWNYERLKKLHAQGVAASEEFKDARDRYHAVRARVERLQAEVEVLQTRLDDTHIRAPVSGHLAEHLVDVGDFVDIGDVLTHLYVTDPIELAFSVSEKFAGKIKTGQAVQARAEAYPDRTFHGEVSFVSPVVDPATRMLRVKTRLPNPDAALKPGAFATAHVTIATHPNRPVVPEACLVSARSGYTIFVVENEVAHRRDVEIGMRLPGRVEIRSGAAVGERVVRTGHMRLTDKDMIRIVKNESSTQPTSQSTRPPTTTQAAETTEEP